MLDETTDDRIAYRLERVEAKVNSTNNNGWDTESDSLAFVSTVDYRAGEEYKYTYTSNVDPMSLISGYGISFESNPFSDITIDVPNFLFGKPKMVKDFLDKKKCFDIELMKELGIKEISRLNYLSFRISQT